MMMKSLINTKNILDRDKFCKLTRATLDEELARAGATRVKEGEPDVKSTAKLVGSPAAVASVPDGWLTDRVRQSCKILAPNSSGDVLGAKVGSADDDTLHFNEVVGATARIQQTAQCEDVSCELV